MLLSLSFACLLLVLPLLVHLTLLGWRRRGRRLMGPGLAFLAAFALGLLTPLAAGILAMRSIEASLRPDEPKCLTGAAVFFAGGYLLTLVGVPLIGLLHWGGSWLADRLSPRVLRLHQ